jgi:hypothetical protein
MNAASDIVTLVDLAIAVTVVEGVVLVLLHRAGGRGVAPRDYLPNLLAGLCLMVALRCLAGGAAPAWIALWLLIAGLAHVTDLRRRWRRGPRARPGTGRVPT